MKESTAREDGAKAHDDGYKCVISQWLNEQSTQEIRAITNFRAYSEQWKKGWTQQSLATNQTS